MVTKTFNIIITGDATSALKSLGEVGLGTAALGEASTKAEPKLTSLGQAFETRGASAKVAQAAFYELSAVTGHLGLASEAAAHQVDQLGVRLVESGANGVQNAIRMGVLAAAILTVAEVGKKSVEAFTSQAEAVEKISVVTKSSTEDASRLTGTLQDLHVNTDTATAAFSRMERAIDTGTLQKYGVAVAKAADGSVDFNKTLANVVGAYDDTQSGATRAAFATAVFGRGYTELIPLLAKSKEQLEALNATAGDRHPILSKQDEANAKAFSLQMATLHDELTKIEVDIGSGIVPDLTKMASGLDQIAGLVQKIPHLGDGLKDAFATMTGLNVLSWLGDLSGKSKTAKDSQAALGDQAAQTSQQLQDQAAAAQKLTTELDSLDKTVSSGLALRSAQLNLEQQTVGWQQQQAQVAQQRATDIASANQQIADSEQAVADARRQAADTAQSDADAVVSGQEKVASIQQKILDQQRAIDTSAQQTADAQLALARVEQDVALGRIGGTDATRQVADAATNLRRAQQDQQATADKNAEQAQQNNEDLVDAQHSLDEAVGKSAEDQVKSQQAVQKAVEAVSTAQAGLTKAQGEGALSALDLQQHELAVEQAQNAVSTATQALHADMTDLGNALADNVHNLGELQALIQQYPDLGPYLQPLIDQLNAAAAAAQAAAQAAAAIDRSGLLGLLNLIQGVPSSPKQTGITQNPDTSIGGLLNPLGLTSHGVQGHASAYTAPSVTVHVNMPAGTVVADRRSLEVLGTQVAEHVANTLTQGFRSGTRYPWMRAA